jgi:hypothetical protein
MKTNMVKENMKAWENPHLAKMLYNVCTGVKDGLGCQSPSLPHLSCKMLLGAGSRGRSLAIKATGYFTDFTSVL